MPERKVFVLTNKKQYFGAKLSKYSFERTLPADSNIAVEIVVVNDLPLFQQFEGATFRRGDETRTYTLDDLQSFTLARFLPPELMEYTGQALPIDPDIFALSDVTELFDMAVEGKAIAACENKGFWDSSVMLLDCSKLRHWKVAEMLTALETGEEDYATYMQLKKEQSVYPISRIWNSIDVLTEDTKILHTSNRETQPWKTGLPIDFTRNRLPKLFGIIPREPIFKLLGKIETTYQPHPDSGIENFFIELAKDAYTAGVFTKEELEVEMRQNHVRHDMATLLNI